MAFLNKALRLLQWELGAFLGPLASSAETLADQKRKHSPARDYGRANLQPRDSESLHPSPLLPVYLPRIHWVATSEKMAPSWVTNYSNSHSGDPEVCCYTAGLEPK